MDFKEIYKEESGYDVGRYNIDNTNYYSEDYVEWLEKKLRIGGVVERSEQLNKRPNTSSTLECFTKSEKQSKIYYHGTNT